MWAPLPACPRECDKSVGGNDAIGDGHEMTAMVQEKTKEFDDRPACLANHNDRRTRVISRGDLVVVVVIIIITVDGGQRSKERRKAQQFLVFPRKNVTGCILGCHGVVVAVVPRLQCSPGHYNTRRLFDERSFPFL